jgi:DNA-directed RNA polymerase alpha subunit
MEGQLDNIECIPVLDALFANQRDDHVLAAIEHLCKIYIQQKGRQPRHLLERVQAIASTYSVRDIPLHELPFSVRTNRILSQNDFKSLGDIIDAPVDKLSKLAGMGPKSLSEIQHNISWYTKGE